MKISKIALIIGILSLPAFILSPFASNILAGVAILLGLFAATNNKEEFRKYKPVVILTVVFAVTTLLATCHRSDPVLYHCERMDYYNGLNNINYFNTYTEEEAIALAKANFRCLENATGTHIDNIWYIEGNCIVAKGEVQTLKIEITERVSEFYMSIPYEEYDSEGKLINEGTQGHMCI
ncbi:MAG: hypothetical protein KKG59_06810 [Nanoarchaeota archaeon]|nr:hypothetical protein [Nanoarchaeota archaeon]